MNPLYGHQYLLKLKAAIVFWGLSAKHKKKNIVFLRGTLYIEVLH